MLFTSPAFKDMQDHQPTSIDDKKKIIRRTAFPSLPADSVGSHSPRPGRALESVDKRVLWKVLYNQA